VGGMNYVAVREESADYNLDPKFDSGIASREDQNTQHE